MALCLRQLPRLTNAVFHHQRHAEILSALFSTSCRCKAENATSKELINRLHIRGVDILRNPMINKGQAFTLEERQLMGIHGLLPPCIISQEQQMNRIMTNFHRWGNDLDRYIYMIALQDRNERLFYRVLTEHVEEMMPIMYTPTVGQACQLYGMVFRRPRGLFITIKDIGNVDKVLSNWPATDVKAIVVTDGERILGLGDLGAYGMGIPVGKLSLYTALGGIDPAHCLPILLDVGTNNDSIRDDPLYIGLTQKRVTGELYDQFLDEFMQAVVNRYGQNTLIQFEDFANKNAFRLLQKYRDDYCMFNDDIQGTAAVAAAGIIASLRITGSRLSENTFVFQGAGEASIGIAHLVSTAMEEEGTSRAEALEKIYLVDSKGLIVKDRTTGGITEHKAPFAKNMKMIDTLADVVKTVKPTVLIGAAAVPNVFTESILRDMASFNKRPVIFALSNPTSKAECTAEEAYRYTEGRCVFASGSPFPAQEVNGKMMYPGQGNNAYIFPGVALGAITCGIRHIPESVFLSAAQALAELVTQQHLDEGRVYPPLSDIRDISIKIAVQVAEFAYKVGLAGRYPEPKDKEAYIRSCLYQTTYESFVPNQWEWK